LFGHLPYSPDLVPGDYHLSTYLKNLLKLQHFNNNEFVECVKMWLSSEMADFFNTGIRKLIPQYDKCLSSSGDYVEK
jgi:hypothetical protein